MTLEALRCFCAVLEAGSFRAAAEQVHRSQPAVSQQIRSLEKELGHPLIDRKLGRATPLGQLLYERAHAILLSVDALAHEVADFDEGAGRELRVGTSDTTALYVLPPHVRRFADAWPQVRLVLVNRNSDAIVEMVLRGELDLGIVTLPQRHAQLEEQELFQQRLVLVAPAAHRLAHAHRVHLDDLRHEPMLLIDEQTRTGALLRSYFHKQDFEPLVVLHSGSFEVIKRYITEGVGLSFLPETALIRSDSGLAAVPVPGLPHVSIGAIWRKRGYRSKAERAFLELLAHT